MKTYNNNKMNPIFTFSFAIPLISSNTMAIHTNREPLNINEQMKNDSKIINSEFYQAQVVLDIWKKELYIY